MQENIISLRTNLCTVVGFTTFHVAGSILQRFFLIRVLGTVVDVSAVMVTWISLEAAVLAPAIYFWHSGDLRKKAWKWVSSAIGKADNQVHPVME